MGKLEVGTLIDQLLTMKESKAERRAKISRLEEAMTAREDNLGEDPFPLTHSFAPGLYAREIFAPAGMLIVTKLHKQEHFIFMLSGDVSVLSEYGVERIKGPCMFKSPVGAKRAVYTHKDTVWVNVHHNPENSTDMFELEKNLIAENYAELGLEDPAQILKLKEGC